jgi:hypothetical protein
MRKMAVTLLLLLAILLFGCAEKTVEKENTGEPKDVKKAREDLIIKLDFKEFPRRYTCDGEDVSPKITVENAEGESIAIIMDDPDAPFETFTHWLIWNVPITDEIPENIPKSGVVEEIGAVQGKNGFGYVGYGGPCPSEGSKHRYFVRVYVLDILLELKPGASRSDLENAMRGHILQQNYTMAEYKR